MSANLLSLAINLSPLHERTSFKFQLSVKLAAFTPNWNFNEAKLIWKKKIKRQIYC